MLDGQTNAEWRHAGDPKKKIFHSVADAGIGFQQAAKPPNTLVCNQQTIWNAQRPDKLVEIEEQNKFDNEILL